jgi:hypothetical protein
MQLSRRKAKILTSAISQWMKDGMVSEEQGAILLNSYNIAGFDWRRLAKCSFLIAIVCFIIATIAILADEYIIEFIQKLFSAPYWLLCGISLFVAAGAYILGARRKIKVSEKFYSNHALLLLGVLATASAVYSFGKAIDDGTGQVSILFLIASVVYGVTALCVPSRLVWMFSILALGLWMGTKTGELSDWGTHYLGMNYPLRFVLFGAALTATSMIFLKWNARKEFFQSTRVIGLLYLFISLWILSIFGNHGGLETWENVRQVELLQWSLPFGAAAGVAIFYGITRGDGVSWSFGVIFLLINIYTRYFEYFWDSLHKSVFFGLLGISFWLLGSRAEKIWNLWNKTDQRLIEDA